jgi:hypothetical protein
MKTTLTIFLFAISVALKAQCGFTLPDNSTVCINSALTLTATGAGTYSWTYNGGGTFEVKTTTDTSKFTYTYGWSKMVTIRAELNGCVELKTISVTVVNCAVGLQEYQLNGIEPVYYDIFGKRTEKLYNELLIEQRGNYRRKVIFTNSH